ncbi:MAG: hypothetical protein HYX28_02640 [Candidatus Koribacter versatilis]|uniref:Uncharacterized protein n=1 Tax=Candidatus Korobacter versatilis TaxID=658062 RepID=A0A932A7M8_9BACT|nr:hypothetical protein [Candidatus Koribacter versatilis]
MTQLFGSAIRSLPYPLFLRLFSLHRRLLAMPKERRVAAQAKLPLLDGLDLSRHKRSDTLFVLASGSSINQISAARWDAIAQHDSVGFNFWLYHRFVPSLFIFENVWRSYAPETYDRLRAAMQERASDYRDVPKIVMDFDDCELPLVLDLPEQWRAHLFAVMELTLPARTAEEVAYGLRYFRARGAFCASSPVQSLFKYGSTLTSIVALGARMQYRRIVLCGVDLSDGRYFYQDSVRYPRTRDLEFMHRAQLHLTEQPVAWRVPASQVVLEMKRHVLDPAGIELYVENTSSRLYPEVPLAPDSLFQLPAEQALHGLREKRC